MAGSTHLGPVFSALLLLTLAITNVWVASPAQASDVAFGSVIDLSNDAVASGLPHIAAVGNDVYVAWLNNTLGDGDILFKASTNNGSSFGPVINLSNTPTGDSENLQIAAVGSSAYIVWQDNATGNNEIMFRASTNNGASFGSAINLSSDSRDSSVPQVAAAGNNVYVTWQTATSRNPDILFRASSNDGASFGSVINLSNNPSSFSLNPQIAASGNYVYVTWRDNNPGNAQTFFALSSTGGSSFTGPVSLSNSPAGETDFDQQVAAPGSIVYVAWTNDTLANDDIMLAASTNNGASFGLAKNLSSNPGVSLTPKLAATSIYVHVVWSDSTAGNSEIFYRASGNSGATFGGIVNLSNTPGTSANPSAAAVGSNLYILWVESISGNDEVFLRTSSDNGASFGALINVSSDTGFSESPTAAGVGSNVYVAWQDDTPGNDDIMFRRGLPVTVPPHANSASKATFENRSAIIVLSGNDSQGLQLIFTIVAGPTHGTLGPITPSGRNYSFVTYTPNANYVGTDSFTFKANNGSLDGAPATISIIVIEVVSPSEGGGGRAIPV